MKKLTIIYDDKIELDLSGLALLMKQAVKLELETVRDLPIANSGRGHHKHHEPGMTTGQCVMQHFTPDGSFRLEQGKKWLTEVGYAPSDSVFWRLQKAGYIRNIGGGKFQFMKPWGALI